MVILRLSWRLPILKPFRRFRPFRPASFGHQHYKASVPTLQKSAPKMVPRQDITMGQFMRRYPNVLRA